VLGEDTRDRIIAKGIDPARVAVVRDGARLPQEQGSREHPAVHEIRSGFRFVILHAGNLGFYGAWDTLLRAAEMLSGDGIGFVFVGEGAQRERIAASANGCPNIKLLPFRPPEEVRHVLAAADLHVVTVRRGLQGVVVPSKLYPILAAGRPILALAPRDCDAARVVESSGCGVVADPDDPVSLLNMIQDLARDPARVADMGRRAREVAPKFAMHKELQRFNEIVEEVWIKRRDQKHVATDAGLGDRGSIIHRLPLG
jgi:glycosyltransferase involved in cell wall biosynthesis